MIKNKNIRTYQALFPDFRWVTQSGMYSLLTGINGDMTLKIFHGRPPLYEIEIKIRESSCWYTLVELEEALRILKKERAGKGKGKGKGYI